MKDIYAEFKKVFKDPYIHLGMDEVFYSCWKSSPDITKFMQTHGFKEYHEVEEYYTKRTLTNVKDVGYKYIIWQDPVDNGVTLAADSIVGVWKDKYLDSEMDLWQNYISRIAKKSKLLLCLFFSYSQPSFVCRVPDHPLRLLVPELHHHSVPGQGLGGALPV